ncbi:MAG: substrate-binding domain-containing protein [Gemmataceae bacterium]|nr:substrate-binding domain-containing protein [Gemmata sp.]MDW8196473.1 substrate-binding domain-containing protein [Gemmataceae bacterium]
MRWFFILCGILVVCSGCLNAPEKCITLATTTSTRDTGLLDELIPRFRAKTGIEVRVVAVGTGQALEIGRRGDADVLLTHDPAAEQRFLHEHQGTSRNELMTNDFVLVGPPDDPANVRAAPSGADAFRRIGQAQAVFISRADESGTHHKEKATWLAAGLEPAGDWYIRCGQGMGAVLRMADEKRGYTLADRGTFIAQRAKLNLAILHSGDPEWINRYSVIAVNPQQHPHVKDVWAAEFITYLLSSEAQQIIAEFGRSQYGEPLFRASRWPLRNGH